MMNAVGPIPPLPPSLFFLLLCLTKEFTSFDKPLPHHPPPILPFPPTLACFLTGMPPLVYPPTLLLLSFTMPSHTTPLTPPHPSSSSACLCNLSIPNNKQNRLLRCLSGLRSIPNTPPPLSPPPNPFSGQPRPNIHPSVDLSPLSLSRFSLNLPLPTPHTLPFRPHPLSPLFYRHLTAGFFSSTQ